MFFLAVLSAQTPPGPTAFSARAELKADALRPGESYEIRIEYDLGDGFTASDAGLPAPLLQIQVPPSVRLTGAYRDTLQQQLRFDFLHTPYEQLLVKPGGTDIGFEVQTAPSAGDVVFLNVIAYLERSRPLDAYMVRRRLALPLAPNATAADVDPSSSNWGPGGFLQIGDRAEPFELPRADGSLVSLGSLLGRQNVVVLTYRAHW